MTYADALKAAGRLALAAQLVAGRIKLDAPEIEALRRALSDYDAAVMELTDAQESTPPLPGDYDPRATDEQCRCPKCGSFRPGYPYHVKDPCLRCGYAPGGCCTVCREPDEIKPEGER
jgi:hypothetical protein